MDSNENVRKASRGPELPLRDKAALTYGEVEVLGYCSERMLRKLVSTGKVKRAVLRAGRTIRFLHDVLVDELRKG